MRAFSRVAGVAVEDLGGIWAAYSPLSGGSLLLNDSSAAVLDTLAVGRALSSDAVSRELAALVGLPASEIERRIRPHWDELVSAGLIHEHAEFG